MRMETERSISPPATLRREGARRRRSVGKPPMPSTLSNPSGSGGLANSVVPAGVLLESGIELARMHGNGIQFPFVRNGPRIELLDAARERALVELSLIHISEPTRLGM